MAANCVYIPPSSESQYAHNPRDSNYTRYVGYAENNPSALKFFSPQTLNMISKKVTELTRGVHPSNRPIVVPNDKIRNVMDSIYISNRPATQDIVTRYVVPAGTSTAVSDFQKLVDQTIEVIVSDIRNNIETEINNSKLSAWTTVLGEFNSNGLRSYAPIKTRDRKWQSMFFFENY